MPSVAVIGAGVIGLSTAVCLQQTCPHIQVTIIADRFGPETTSDGAAGLFRPTLDLVPGVEPDLLRKWLSGSWKHYENLARSEESGKAGVYLHSVYHVYDEGKAYVKKPLLLEEFAPNLRHMTDEEHRYFSCPRKKYGLFYSSYMIECRWYLPWLKEKFLKNGGRIKHSTVRAIEELSGQFDVVVNCSGLRARELVGDVVMVPNRGQVFKVKAPWIKHCVFMDDLCWIIPGREWVVVGGTRQDNNPDQTIQEQDKQDVWNRACQAVPSLKHAEVISVWAGLRPYRNPLRLEIETFNNGKKPLKVVHNYGHGSNGVGLSWGTAQHAVELVQKCLHTPEHSKL